MYNSSQTSNTSLGLVKYRQPPICNQENLRVNLNCYADFSITTIGASIEAVRESDSGLYVCLEMDPFGKLVFSLPLNILVEGMSTFSLYKI